MTLKTVLQHFARLVWFILAALTKLIEVLLTRVARIAPAGRESQYRRQTGTTQETNGIATTGIVLHAHLTRAWPYPSGFT